MIQIQWSCSSLEEARKIIRLLLENKLVACATIIPHVESHYIWQGAIETSTEVKVYLKTEEHRFKEIELMIRKHCSYQIPEIVSFKALAVSHTYEKWVLETVKSV